MDSIELRPANNTEPWQVVEKTALPRLSRFRRLLARPSTMTIRLRLTLWYTALLGATLILFSVLVYSFLVTNLWIRVQDDAARQAMIVSRTVTAQLQRDVFVLPLNPFSAQLGELDFYASGIGVQLIALNGEVAGQSANLKRTGVEVPNYQRALASINRGLSDRYTTTFRGGTVLVYSVPVWK